MQAAVIPRHGSSEQVEVLEVPRPGLFPGGVRVQLRAAAKSKGFDPNRWFDNVEVLAARSIGSETVRYVGNIAKYYVAYRMIATQLGSAPDGPRTALPLTDPNAPS